MRIASLILSSAFFLADGKLPRVTRHRHLTPEELGAYHTDAFDVLGEKYSHQKPKHIDEIIEDLGEVLAGYCPEDDSKCALGAYEVTRREFESKRRGKRRELNFPADFDPRLKKSISTMISHIETIDERNLDEVMNSLIHIKEEMEDMPNVNVDQQHVGLVGVSVAIESTKLWHSTYYDRNHPLHEMINYFEDESENRRLQLSQLTNLLGMFDISTISECIDPAVIMSDVQAGMGIGMATIQTNLQNITGIRDMLFLTPVISASASEFFMGSGIYYEYYEYEYEEEEEDCVVAILSTFGVCIPTNA